MSLSSSDVTPKMLPHGRIAKVLHWSTALLLLFAYIANTDVTNALRDPVAMQQEVILGVAIAVVFAARFLWMRYLNQGASRLPTHAPAWERKLAPLAHYGLYLCVMAIVLTGLAIPVAQNNFSDGTLRAVIDLHEFTTNTTLIVIAAHIAAALWHKLVRRDGVWESIGTPWNWFVRLGRRKAIKQKLV